jgi:hypothetical protein
MIQCRYVGITLAVITGWTLVTADPQYASQTGDGNPGAERFLTQEPAETVTAPSTTGGVVDLAAKGIGIGFGSADLTVRST